MNVLRIKREGHTITSLRRAFRKPLVTIQSHVGVGPLVNGDFSDPDPLHGWLASESDGAATPGTVIELAGTAVIDEGDSFLVTLQQTFLIPEGGGLSLSFDLIVQPGFDLSGDGIPDAFEASLLDQSNLPVVTPWDALATSFFNMQEDDTVNMGATTTWDGLTATVDLTAVPGGTEVTLFFDLIGADNDTGSGVTIDNVIITGLNEPPICDAGGPYVAECNGAETTVTLDASASFDPDENDSISYAWTTDCPGTFDDTRLATPILTLDAACPALPECMATLTVTDDAGASDECTVPVTVEDTTAPALIVDATPVEVVDLDCSGDESVALPTATASDACGEVNITDDAPASFPAGTTTTVTYTATDDCGNEANEAVDVTVLYGADIYVTAALHTVGFGSFPGSTKQPLVGIDVCAYDQSDGGCARVTCGGISHREYECIATTCVPVSCCTTDESGECFVNVPPGNYIVVSNDATKTVLPDPLGVSVGDVSCGEVKTKHLQQILKVDGKKVPGKTTRLTGSELLIVEPEYIVWDDTEQVYPFVFETIGDWDVTVSVAPPDGFVADQTALSEDVNNELEAIQFTIIEVGSDLVPTGTTFAAVHEGRMETVESNVDIYLTSEYARSQGHSVALLSAMGLIKDAPATQVVGDGPALCGAAGGGCGPVGPAMILTMLGLLGLRFLSGRRQE